jgi:hypothetical protein
MSQITSRLHTGSMPGWRLLGAACLAALALTACEAEDGLVDGGPQDTFTQLYAAIGSQCGSCHAPGAPGNTEGVEQTQDWSSPESARASLQGMASGLIGNFQDCNGVPFIGDSVETSLLVAAFDPDVRADFTVASNPACNADTISNMLEKSPISADEVALLKQFVMEEIAGSP